MLKITESPKNKRYRQMNFLQNLLVRGEPGATDESTESSSAAAAEAPKEQLSQDELRRRRLAKLDSAPKSDEQNEPKPAPSGSSPSVAKSPPPATKQQQSSTGEKPSVGVAKMAVVEEEKSASSRSPPAQAKSPEVSPANTASPAAEKPAAQKRDVINDALVQLLRLSLTPSRFKEVLYLPLVSAEVGSTSLNDATVDSAICGRLYTDLNDLEPRPIESFLRYVLACMERFPAVRRQYRADENPALAATLDTVHKLLINYVVTYLTEPGLFPSAHLAKMASGPCAPEHELIDLLRKPETSANTIHLLQTIFPEVVAQKVGKQIVLPILQKLSQDQRANKNETLEFVLAQLCCARVEKVGGWGQFITEILAEERATKDYEKRKDFFQPHVRGRRFEEESLLGPFFSAPQIEFDKGSPVNQGTVISKRKVLAARLDSLKTAVLEICKSNETARDDMLKWFDQALELNSERSKDRPDPFKVSSEQFANNVCAVLLHLCEPFLSLEKSTSMLPTLVNEVTECISSSRAFAGDSTKLGSKEEDETAKPPGAAVVVPSTGASTESSSAKKAKKKTKFPSRAFALTLRAIDLGPIVTYRMLGLMHRQLRFVRDDEGEEGPHFKRLIELMNIYIAFGFEPTYVSHLLSFASLTSRWVMSLQMNLSGEAPAWNDRPLTDELLASLKLDSKLSQLPEFIVSDIAEIYVQVGQHSPNELNVQGQEILRWVLDFFIAVIATGDAIVHQPHIRANMGDAIFYAFLPEEAKHQNQGDRAPRIWGAQKGPKELVLEVCPIAKMRLVPALLRLYGDVQVTGYYQVAAHRQLITKVLGYLWTIDQHRPAFRTFAETSLIKDGRGAEDSAFVKFANGILNQTNSNVAESLAKLREIRKTQMDMKNHRVWMEQSEEERNQRTVLLESNEKEVSACLMMANDATDMLSYLSSDPTFVKAFTVPALRSRLVDMLCNILASLGSRKAAEFKIDNPEKYNFFPKKMLEEVFQTLLNCAKVVQGAEEDAKQFVRTVANCAYYDYDTFTHAAKLVRKHGIVNDAQSLDLFTKFVEDCEQAKKEMQAMEEELGEAPEEFLDPLMSTVMEDPVILPGSKMTVDRSTIMHHLLQNTNDPFDRSPLDASMLREDTELKQKIMAWKTGAGKKM